MKIEQGIMTKMFFDNFGSARYFSAEFEIQVYSQNLPAFCFPKDDEKILKEKLENMFNVNVGENVNVPVVLISMNSQIWGVANKNGEIFSMESIYLPDEKLKFSRSPGNCLKIFDEAYPTMKDILSKENRVNAAMALFDLGVSESEKSLSSNIFKYYQSLVLANHLNETLSNENVEKRQLKI